MVYDECYDEEPEEYEDLDDEEEEEEEEEEVEFYDFVEEVRRLGNTIEIKISAIDICCPVVLRLPIHQTYSLIRELIKLLNKDEIKELVTEVFDGLIK